MVCMYHSFLIHSSADGHLGCFHVLAIINIHCNFWPTNKSSHRALRGCEDVCYKWTSHSCDKGVSFLLVSKGWCCFCSVTKSCPVLCNPTHWSTPGSSVFYYFLEFAQMHVIELVMLFKNLITCCPLLLLPSTFPSIRVFSSGPALHIRWPK